MSSATCHFCAHGNPAGSKFCNECGSPLDLKPCAKCEAMNHVAVDRCYQCGTPFAIDEKLELAEASTGKASAAAADAGKASIETASPRRESADPLPDRIPVVLSQRIDPASVPSGPPRQDRAHAQLSAKDPRSHPLADEDPWIDPRRSSVTARDTVRIAQRRGAARAVFAGVVVCAIVGAGYYAYQAQMLPRVTDVARTLHLSDDPTSPAEPASSATPSPASPMGTASAPPATPREESRQGSAAGAPAISPATTGASAPGATTEAAPTPALPSASAPASASPAAPSASTGSPTTSTPASTTARRRNVPRGAPAPPKRNSAAQPTIDKDAAATQRLIERDLGRFLPPERTEQFPPR